MAFTVYHNNPVAGSIAWSDLHIQYLGVTYTIANGYTNSVYVYWTPAYPNNLVVSNSFPTLGADDCLVLLNKNGIALIVPTASVTPGDLIVPGTIMSNAIAANAITSTLLSANAVTAGKIAANAVTADTVAANAIGAEKIAAGAIIADKILTGAVTTDKLAASAVTANKILAGTITADRIDLADLFAAAATINAIKTMTVKSIEDGATLVINKNVISMEAPTLSIVATGSEDGQEVARFDQAGGHFKEVSVDGRIDCDMLAWRYTGPATYANVTSMVDILDSLNRCYLDYDVTISLTSGLGTISEAIEFIGIHGPGKITLNGNTASAPSGVKITSCTTDITFDELYAAYTMWHAPYCHFINCTATGSYTASGTETKNATPARTKQGSSSWRSDTDYVWQGYTEGTGRNYATFWFPGLTTIPGESIKSASVRLKRVSGIGKGDTVNVNAYTATNPLPSGNFSGLVSRGQLGVISNGETKTFALAPAAAAVLCAGGCLVLDPGDTSTLSGKVYSSNYCKYYGVGTGYEPVLSVTYEIAGQTITKESTFVRNNHNHPDWIYPTILAGTSIDTDYGNGRIRCRKEGNHVSVEGGLGAVSWTGSSLLICTLPYGPGRSNRYWIKACSGSNVARVYVRPDGNMYLEWVKKLSDGANLTTFNAWVDMSLDFWTD